MTSETKNNTRVYAYDSLDNRIKVDGDELQYNGLNQLMSYSQSEFTYDSYGNLKQKRIGSDETKFESNILSELISVEHSDQTANTFSYDPFHRLVVEKHLDTHGKNKRTLSTSRYFYIGHQEIGSLTDTGEIETLKVPGLDGDTLSLLSIAFEIKGATYVPIHDIRGNVISLVDPETRRVEERCEYTAFGEETIYNAEGERIQSSFNPWRFSEKRVHEKTGLILFGHRFYDPSSGRWISEDPAGFLDGPNLYAYLHNNPFHYLDRFGLSSEPTDQNKFGDYFYGEVESHCFCEKHRTCKRGGDLDTTSSSTLPTITYHDRFEETFSNHRSEEEFWETEHLYDSFRPYYERSKTYDLSAHGLPDLPNRGIGFINGIGNTIQDAEKSAMHISQISGGYNIQGVYNATHGFMVNFLECRMGLNYIATEPVRQLHKMWNSFFEKQQGGAKFLMICHSQGAIHVRNALLDYPPELRKRILVVAIAPGAYIFQETCAKVLHYRAHGKRDFVPGLDTEGKKREKSTTITLDSHPDAKLFDHEFISPTYQKKLYEHIHNYIKNHGEMF